MVVVEKLTAVVVTVVVAVAADAVDTGATVARKVVGIMIVVDVETPFDFVVLGVVAVVGAVSVFLASAVARAP